MRAFLRQIRNFPLQALLFAALYAVPAQAQDITTGLVGHWQLNETSGTTAADSSGGGYDGSMLNGLNGANDSINGKIGTALDFDGNDYIDMGNIGIVTNQPASSICLWYNYRGVDPLTEREMLIAEWQSGFHGWFLMLDQGAQAIAFTPSTLFGNTINTGNNSIVANEWTHVCATFQASTFTRLYVNGTMITEDTAGIPSVMHNGSLNLRIASQQFGNQFNGFIDDVRIYNRALKDEDVFALAKTFYGPMTCNAAYEAVMIFNHEQRVMQYCNGTDWISMGKQLDIGPTEGLSGHWPLDDTDTTASALAGPDGSLDGGLDGASDSVLARYGNGLQFDGVDDSVNLGTTGIVNNIFATGGTFAAWYWIDPSASGFRFFDKNQGAAPNDGYLASEVSGKYNFTRHFSGNQGRWETTTDVPKGSWVHVAMTYDASATTNDPIVYFDGVAQPITEQSAPAGTVDDDTGNILHIGNRNDLGRALNGILDDVRIYDRVLTATEIGQLRNAHTPALVSCTSPDGEAGEVGYNFTEGVMQYCNGANWINMGPVIETNNYNYQGGPNNCATAGDQCTDNSYYIGTHPVTAEELFLADEDTQTALPWNNGNSTDLTVTGAIDTNDGPANTATNIATDADSATAGTQPHQASQYCEDLEAHGRSDWYLPAINELVLVYNGGGGNQFGNVNTSGSTDDYWSSSENNRNLRMNNGIQSNRAKHLLEYVRCMARGRTGLRLHLQFDETSGTTAADSSGNTLDGSLDNGLNAATNSVAGIAGRALDFDGSDDRVSIPADPLHNDSTTSTYAGWFYPTSTTQNRRFFENGVTILNQWSNGQIRIDMGRWSGGYANWETATGVITPNEWQHIALTYDYGSTANDPVLYVNGVSVDLTETTAPSGTVTDTANYAIFVGNRSDSARPWAGRIDDFRMYDRVLTASEVASLFANTGGGSLPVTGCPNIGDVCDDGTVYAGDHPTSGEKLYVPPADNASDINWGANSAFVTAALSNTDGAANTNALDGAVDVGAPYPAAQLCADLTAYGSSDWYLPARDELTVLYNNQGAIGGFDTGGEMYWSSTESTTLDPGERAWSRRFSDGYEWHNAMFVNTLSVRCMRIGSSVAGARCVNPPGTSGEMIYNDDNNVMQYCVGTDDVPPNGWVETR